MGRYRIQYYACAFKLKVLIYQEYCYYSIYLLDFFLEQLLFSFINTKLSHRNASKIYQVKMKIELIRETLKLKQLQGNYIQNSFYIILIFISFCLIPIILSQIFSSFFYNDIYYHNNQSIW
ncbi:unnamed protein product [Paramecium sonneborni]|uniref:Transmembrane protein n=1 Tax=Paramecium sonneborni TaxID=65129 RepID=A0A8S1PIE6_9CILI|nr:unnamed protein product [Paramecium sonneborni]